MTHPNGVRQSGFKIKVTVRWSIENDSGKRETAHPNVKQEKGETTAE